MMHRQRSRKIILKSVRYAIIGLLLHLVQACAMSSIHNDILDDYDILSFSVIQRKLLVIGGIETQTRPSYTNNKHANMYHYCKNKFKSETGVKIHQSKSSF